VLIFSQTEHFLNVALTIWSILVFDINASAAKATDIPGKCISDCRWGKY